MLVKLSLAGTPDDGPAKPDEHLLSQAGRLSRPD